MDRIKFKTIEIVQRKSYLNLNVFKSGNNRFLIKDEKQKKNEYLSH